MAFGVAQDYWALGDTIWEPQSSTLTPQASLANAQDSEGDNACEQQYNAYDQWSVVYKLVGLAADTVTVSSKTKCGTIIAIDTATKGVVTSIEVATANTDFPTITVAGEEWYGDTEARTYTDPFPDISPLKYGQAIGFVADTYSRVTSSTGSMTVQVARVADSVGVFVRTAVYQGRAEASGELVHCTTTAGAVADTAHGWALTKNNDVNSDNASFGTSTVNAYQNVSAD